MNRIISLIFSLAFAAAGSLAAGRPNIVLILADDLGFSDLGCYGSEIATPNLDRLAAGGVRFTQFYNTAKCHSSRVSLLSGRWCRQAGDTKLPRAVIIPEVLGSAGYFTAMTGKWHLDKEPTDFGFARYFGHLSGATSYYKGDKTFRLNGQAWTVPDKGFYTTVANVDHALNFLADARTSKKPWFLYVAFNAPHAPLQPMEADYKKYLGKYDAGWDVMRAARVAKQKELGLFGKDTRASARPDHVPAWSALSPEMQTWERRRMAAYAGLIDRVDQEVGRLVADLKSKGEFDNTLILFVSDNGACPYDRRSVGRDLEPCNPESSWSDSTGWAWARNSPFRYYKQNQFEGGIATPAIMHWPAGLKTRPGALVHSPAHLVDVLPTLAEVAGAPLPKTWPGRELTPLAGISLAPILAGGEIKSRPPIHLLFSSDRGLRDGDWKLVSFQSQPWELYNLAEDRTELHNVAAKHPEIVSRMVKQWHDMALNVLMTPAKERTPVATTATEPRRNPQWTDYTSPEASAARHDAQKKKRKASAQADPTPAKNLAIRARTNTKLAVEGDQLVITCTGSDSGLSFDRLPDLKAAGPYQLVFSLQGKAGGDGEIFWTTDAKTILPKGHHQPFEVKHDGEWHNITLAIDTPEKLHAFRLDPCSAPGVVRIKGLTLQTVSGQALQSWPAVAR
ncbi:MAG: arylsulfatase [Limisphaerales bacterium]